MTRSLPRGLVPREDIGRYRRPDRNAMDQVRVRILWNEEGRPTAATDAYLAMAD